MSPEAIEEPVRTVTVRSGEGEEEEATSTTSIASTTTTTSFLGMPSCRSGPRVPCSRSTLGTVTPQTSGAQSC